MSSTKIINAIMLAVVVGAAAWGLTFVRMQKPGDIEHPLAGKLDESGDYAYVEGNQYYTIEARYPARTTLVGAADAAARTTLERGVADEVHNFQQIFQESLTADEKARLEQYGRQYAFDAKFQEFGSNNFDSFLYAIYQDTGGAHPNGYFKTFVFNKSGAQVQLADLFVPKATGYLTQIADIATAQIKADIAQRLGDGSENAFFAEGLTPTVENFSNFVIDGDNIHFFFPPYQVAAYAAGTFDVSIPFSKFGSSLAPGVR